MSLRGNTMLFLDTGFFKNYKKKNDTYAKLFAYSREAALILCTSELCLEEWRTQKIQDLQNNIRDINNKISNHCGNNFFSKFLVSENVYEDLQNPIFLKEKSRQIVKDFVSENSIKFYPAVEDHIEATWDAYFEGKVPFKERKNRNDIPDAWIYESAKDAIAASEHLSLSNKYCLTGDGTMRSSLEQIGFSSIELEELISQLADEESGNDTRKNIDIVSTAAKLESSMPNTSTALGEFLSKATSEATKGIYLRLAGYVMPLNTPTHELLIDKVVANGFDRKLTEACAIILSEKANSYIKDTGNHYVVGNKVFCSEASDQLVHEIIDMLGEN